MTQRTLAAIKPDPARVRLVSEGSIPGLYVRVLPSGRRTWLFLHTRQDKQHWHTLGEVGGALAPDDAKLFGLPAEARLDVHNARHAASACRAMVRNGMIPGEVRREAIETRRAEARESRSVQDVAEVWMRDVIQRDYKRPQIVQDVLDRHILPHLGQMRIDRLRRSHASEAIDALVQAGKRVTANRVLSIIKKLARFAHEKGYIEADPVAVLTRNAAGGREKPRKRNLPFDEVATFARILWAPAFFAEPITRHLLQFALLTGQRVGEITGAKWEHFDLEAGKWHMPDSKAGRTDQPRPHLVHLSQSALDVLTEVRRHTERRPFAFESPHTKRPIDPHSLARVVARLFEDPNGPADPKKRKAKPKADRLHKRVKRPEDRPCLFGQMDPFTPHDLRRTMASRMGDLGHMPHVIEKCLNHKLEGVLAVYQHSEWLPERKAAFESWGNKVDALRAADPAKVVHIGRGKTAR